MDYLLTFLEGMIAFISPCLLPMLPIYISYFMGQDGGGSTRRAVKNALGFVLGFTGVFMLLGAFSASVGVFLNQYSKIVNLVFGIIVIFFGLNFMGLIQIKALNTERRMQMKTREMNFFSSFLFGVIFSVGWTPCVGAFLGSALMLAASSTESLKGVLMLLTFSLGLGIPFIVSAIFMEQLKSTMDFIKRHYKVINIVSGALLIAVGILMATGLMGYFLSLFNG